MTGRVFFKALTTFFVYELLRQNDEVERFFIHWFHNAYPKSVSSPNIEESTTGEPDINLLPVLDKFIKDTIWPEIIKYLDISSLQIEIDLMEIRVDMIFEIQQENWPHETHRMFPFSSIFREKLRQGAATQLIREFEGRAGDVKALPVNEAIALFISMYIDRLAEKYLELRTKMTNFAGSVESFTQE